MDKLFLKERKFKLGCSSVRSNFMRMLHMVENKGKFGLGHNMKVLMLCASVGRTYNEKYTTMNENIKIFFMRGKSDG